MAKPPKPTVPAPPLRSAPSTFSALAEAFLNFFPTFATYLDEVGDFTSAQADAALAAALGGTLPSPTGHGGKFIRVKPDETGVEFASVYATTATAAGTTTLTVNSSDGQFFTGATTQTVVLPVVSTLVLGRRFEITNKSAGAITVNSSGGNLVGTVPANTVMSFTCILLTGTTAASWDAKTEGFDITPALIRAQLGLAIGTDVQAYDADLAALAAIDVVEGDIIYCGAAGWTRLAKGTSGQVLAQNAGLTAPEWVSPAATTITPNLLDLFLGGGAINSTGSTFTALNCFALWIWIVSSNDTTTSNLDWQVRFSNDGGSTFGAWQNLWQNLGGTTAKARTVMSLYLDIGATAEFILGYGDASGGGTIDGTLTHPGGTINAIGIRTSGSAMSGTVKIFGIGTEA